jgi:hypothetical protein
MLYLIADLQLRCLQLQSQELNGLAMKDANHLIISESRLSLLFYSAPCLQSVLSWFLVHRELLSFLFLIRMFLDVKTGEATAISL